MRQTEERKQTILERLNRENRVYVSDLSQALEVSEVTIRKDLKELEERGALRRTHGGAANLEEKGAVEPSLDKLLQVHTEEKRAIARGAYKFLEDGDSLLLDASSTVRELAHLIRDGDRRELNVITPALHVAQGLSSCEHVQVIQIGGMVRRSLVTAMGPIATEDLRGLHVDKAFIGVNGIDPAVGLTTQNILECEVKRHIVEACTQSFVLADSSKMRCVALGVICPVGRADYIITDAEVSPAFAGKLEECGARVIVAE